MRLESYSTATLRKLRKDYQEWIDDIDNLLINRAIYSKKAKRERKEARHAKLKLTRAELARLRSYSEPARCEPAAPRWAKCKQARPAIGWRARGLE